MAKSNYPDKLDTSIEIPAVRDNIIEVGSDVLNSVRTAIFQIERTLGINPQGAVGNTVSDRLNKALDGNGNILKTALDRANVLSGPITDKDVSKTAAINESKLRLDYPTQLLQDEVSQLISQLDMIMTTLEELAVLLNAHVHPDATNRHYGKAITIESIDSTSSSTGMVSTETVTAQDLFEGIFQSHINYDGSDISKSNRSHEADQVFFENEEVSAYTNAEDVQEAIEDVFGYTVGQLDIHQNKQHDNGILRTSIIVSAEEDDEGFLLLDDQLVEYDATSPTNIYQSVVVRFPTPPDTPDTEIRKSDILKITDSSGSTEYQVYKVNYSLDGSTIENIEVFGHFPEASEVAAQARVYKNINSEANHAGLLTCCREYQSTTGTSYSNADIIQVANPDSATIISKNINPSETTLISNRYFNITVDDGSEIELDIYESAAPAQSLDTIIKSLNAQFAEHGASVSAYRVDFDENRPSELALVHSLPSDSSASRTLTVSRGDDDALDSLGLASYEDITIDAGLGTIYYIQGKAYNTLGTKLEETGLNLLEGTSSVTSSSVDFVESGVKEGDLLIISGSASDDGTYVVISVTSSSITLDNNQLSGGSWAGASDDDTAFYIYNNSISLRLMQFDTSSSGGSNGAIVDVFMDYNRDIFYNVRLEYGIEANSGGNSLVSIVNFEGDPSVYTEDDEGVLFVEESVDGHPLLSLDGGPTVELKGSENTYIELKSGRYDLKLFIYIENSAFISLFLATSDITMRLYGFEGINEEENLLLSRALFESGTSRVAGAGADYPRLFRRLRRGNLSQKDFGTDAIYANQQRPLKETRSNGVISGLEVSPSDEPINDENHYVLDIVPGVCYVKGKRFEIGLKENLVTGLSSDDTDNIFVAVDEWGSLVFASADGTTCECPFDPYNYCILSSIEYDSVNVVAVDMRLFIDNLDLTVLNSITVSPQKGMGHFSDIGSAIKYAKRFSKLYSKAGVPTIHLKSGVHKVVMNTGTDLGTIDQSIIRQISSDYGFYINFPVNITGEGYSTVIDAMKLFNSQDESDDDRAVAGSADNDAWLVIAGPSLTSTPDGNSDVISNGFVNLSNFRMNLCGVRIYDGTIKDLSGNKLNWGVNISDVIFDHSEKENFGQYNWGVDIRKEDAGAGIDFGNVIISNCQFLNSIIKTVDINAEYHKNISILNNIFRGSGDGNLDGSGNYAFYTGGAGHIFDFDATPSVNNIEFRGNIIADNDGGTEAYIDPNSNFPWGDRISRNLVVGGGVGIGVSNPYNTETLDSPVLLHMKSNENEATIVMEEHINAIGGPDVLFQKSRDGGLVADGDRIGTIFAYGHDGSNFELACGIRFLVGGATDTNDIPGEIRFKTRSIGDTNHKTRLTIKEDGNIGIGEEFTDPLYKLHVMGTSNDSTITIEQDNPAISGPDLRFLKTKGGGAVEEDDYIGSIQFYGHDGVYITNGRAATIYARVDEADASANDVPGRLDFCTRQIGDLQERERLTIKNDGKIGVGTGHPSALLHIYDGESQPCILRIGEKGTFTPGAFDHTESLDSAKIEFLANADHNFGGASIEYVADGLDNGLKIKPLNAANSIFIEGENIYMPDLSNGVEWEVHWDQTDGKLVYSASTERIKKDIRPHNIGLNEVLEMNPVLYKLKGDDTNTDRAGLIAEELYDVNPLLALLMDDYEFDDKGKRGEKKSDNKVPGGWNSQTVISVLINAIKDLNEKVLKLEDALYNKE
jgi:hypothetical protein